MNTPVLADFETCSAVDLRVAGGRNYAKHESTRILIGCFLVDGVFHVWLPGQDIKLPCFNPTSLWPKQFGPYRQVEVWEYTTDLPAPVIYAVQDGREFVFHNGDEFDKHIWREKVKPVPAKFGDTIHAARAAGLPAGLDALGHRFFGLGKDAGHTIMSRMWKLEVDENGGYFNKNQTPGNIAAATRYCIGDVVILEKVYNETLGYGEPSVIDVHRQINNRGVMLDTKLCRTIIDLSHKAAEEAGNEIERITREAGCYLPRESLKSVPKMKAWLKANGVHIDNLKKQTVEQLLTDPDSFLQELDDNGEDDVGG